MYTRLSLPIGAAESAARQLHIYNTRRSSHTSKRRLSFTQFSGTRTCSGDSICATSTITSMPSMGLIGVSNDDIMTGALVPRSGTAHMPITICDGSTSPMQRYRANLTTVHSTLHILGTSSVLQPLLSSSGEVRGCSTHYSVDISTRTDNATKSGDVGNTTEEDGLHIAIGDIFSEVEFDRRVSSPDHLSSDSVNSQGTDHPIISDPNNNSYGITNHSADVAEKSTVHGSSGYGGGSFSFYDEGGEELENLITKSASALEEELDFLNYDEGVEGSSRKKSIKTKSIPKKSKINESNTIKSGTPTKLISITTAANGTNGSKNGFTANHFSINNNKNHTTEGTNTHRKQGSGAGFKVSDFMGALKTGIDATKQRRNHASMTLEEYNGIKKEQGLVGSRSVHKPLLQSEARHDDDETPSPESYIKLPPKKPKRPLCRGIVSGWNFEKGYALLVDSESYCYDTRATYVAFPSSIRFEGGFLSVPITKRTLRVFQTVEFDKAFSKVLGKHIAVNVTSPMGTSVPPGPVTEYQSIKNNSSDDSLSLAEGSYCAVGSLEEDSIFATPNSRAATSDWGHEGSAIQDSTTARGVRSPDAVFRTDISISPFSNDSVIPSSVSNNMGYSSSGTSSIFGADDELQGDIDLSSIGIIETMDDNGGVAGMHRNGSIDGKFDKKMSNKRSHYFETADNTLATIAELNKKGVIRKVKRE
eukprot:Tbor_TRINITY_DN5137_c0_g1::TRINITY_DN5137_c0_g1_i1::g.25565::m.25565